MMTSFNFKQTFLSVIYAYIGLNVTTTSKTKLLFIKHITLHGTILCGTHESILLVTILALFSFNVPNEKASYTKPKKKLAQH